MELEITCLPTWIQGIKSPGRDYTALCSWLAGGRAGGERGLLQVAMPSVLHFDIMCGYKKEGRKELHHRRKPANCRLRLDIRL